VDETSLFVYL